MGQVASERVVNGIKTRVLHGKDYVEVHERIRLIQHDEKAAGYSMLKQERYEWNGRHFISITIDVKGKQYIGDAEVTFDASKNTPAGMSPVETAQTSALGRALAFAGYGTVESIASFDEVYRNTVLIEEAHNGTGCIVEAAKPKALPAAQEQEPASPAPDDAPTPAQLRQRQKELGLQMSFEQIVEKCFNRPIADDELTPTQCVYLSKVYEKKASEKATAGAGGGR